MYIEEQVITWEEAYASVAGADIGMSIYLHTGPQFQNMGISSSKLCMYLSMGIPVIANKQPSFDFVEQYNCGVLVNDEREFVDAINFIQQRLTEMKANAIRCSREYIDTPAKYANLLSGLKAIAWAKPVLWVSLPEEKASPVINRRKVIYSAGKPVGQTLWAKLRFDLVLGFAGIELIDENDDGLQKH